MKKSGYCSILHIYLMFFLALFIVAGFAGFLILSVITVHTPADSIARSDYPMEFTKEFGEQIIFIDDIPKIKQFGLELLQSNQAGIQILNDSGQEIAGYQKPKNTKDFYSDKELLQIYQTGHIEDSQTTSFIGTLTHNGKDFTYILYFPMNISKITMYLNGDRFTAGKSVILLCLGAVFFIILILGFIYGFWITKTTKQMSVSIKNIAGRSYVPVSNNGVFKDVFESLNDLDLEIRASDDLKEQTEKMRKDWIANITHDLKTPLSPIKGYAEVLSEQDITSEEKIKRYSQVILKNVSYIESLIDDLKLTYQLENGMLPIKREKQNFVCFLRELVIDILNNPEYESRIINFTSSKENIMFSFDHKLLTRAFQNLIVNAFIHGNDDTEVTIQISVTGNIMEVIVSDNGNGMSSDETSHLFQRYYRGTDTEKKTAGTGLGLAITKSIIEAGDGTIMVESESGIGTDFKICFPIS
ncbi:MAG: HAMP domain-containing histidine kinase [Lachnospiraceae bacterium]|nr:HAMP domain-containing histidine kinase [Lachnospiraceae bacterium]